KVHRLVLAMWSDVWYAMLFGPMAEKETILLPDDPPEAFGCLLDYLYTGEAKFDDVQTAIQVYYMANKYQVKHLQNICSENLLTSVTAYSVPEAVNVAVLFQDSKLLKRCAEVIFPSSDEVFESPSFRLLSHSSLEWLLSQDLRISSEIMIFHAIKTWGVFQLEQHGIEVTTQTIRQQVETMLKYVRFLSLHPADFDMYIAAANILTHDEVLSIKLLLNGEQGPRSLSFKEPLPDIFSRERTNRIKKVKKLKLEPGIVIYSSPGPWYDFGNEVSVLTDIKPSRTIYLTKFTYKMFAYCSGLQMSVMDTEDEIVQTVDFEDAVGNFNSLKLTPDNTYSITVHNINMNPDDIRLIPIIVKERSSGILGKCTMHFSGYIIVDYWE
ncbi:unnamed protein product, partial [Meganyctiphanes norvegica]